MAETAILHADGIKKTFTLSRKQQKIQRTDEKRKVAVDGLSFSAYSGEVYGLLGPNGAGKTTTLRMISTLIKPDEGDVSVCGYSAITRPQEVRKRIGFMTGELRLEGFFTPSYLVSFFGALHGMDAASIEVRKRELFSRFSMDNYAEVKVKDLSTGMKQKASLVVSIVHNPDVIIFDEPTNGLDVLTARIVTDFIAELKNMGKCVILSTHIFSLAEKLCDRIGIIIDGKKVAEGTLADITCGSTLEDRFFEIYGKAEGNA